MECIVCKKDRGERTTVEELSEEVVLCEECLTGIKNGELDDAVLRLAQSED